MLCRRLPPVAEVSQVALTNFERLRNAFQVATRGCMGKKNREQRAATLPPRVISLPGKIEAISVSVPVSPPSEPNTSPEPEPTASALEAVPASPPEPVSVARIVELVERINVHKRVYRVFPGPRGFDIQFPRASDRLLTEVRQAIAREMPGAAMVNGRPCALTRIE